MSPILAVEDLHASYGKREVLRGISFCVYPGEVVAVFGGNGAGKSTTLKVLAGLLQPTRGKIWLNGADVTDTPAAVRQKRGLGTLLQGGRVFPNLSVEDNLTLARSNRNEVEPRFNQIARDCFPELATRSSDRASLLSGGQRQMLAISMVLAQEPIVTLMDEPTAALQECLAMGFLEGFANAATETKRTILLVEQNKAAAERVLTRQFTLSDGFLVN